MRVSNADGTKIGNALVRYFKGTPSVCGYLKIDIITTYKGNSC